MNSVSPLTPCCLCLIGSRLLVLVVMRIISKIRLADHAQLSPGFICADRDWPMQSHPFKGLVWEGHLCLGIAPRGKAAIEHLAVRVDDASKVTPLPPTRMQVLSTFQSTPSRRRCYPNRPTGSGVYFCSHRYKVDPSRRPPRSASRSNTSRKASGSRRYQRSVKR